jgi:peptidoglycan/LPS O-acetylase OafA/YrhL
MIEQRGAPSTTLFRLAPVLHVGRMSYGIYILHQPMAFVLAVVSGALGTTFLDAGYGHTAAVVVLTYVCSLVSWRYFETPLLRIRDTLERRAEKRAAYSRATA